MPRRYQDTESTHLLFEGGDEAAEKQDASEDLFGCCNCCSKTSCCGAKCIAISLQLLLIAYIFLTIPYDIYLAVMNERFGPEVVAIYSIALVPGIVAIVLFAYWLCCAEQKDAGWAYTTSMWCSFGSLFIYIAWTIIYFAGIWEQDEVEAYAGLNEDGGVNYENEETHKYILYRIVVPVILLILTGILYCTVINSFAHGEKEEVSAEGGDQENTN